MYILSRVCAEFHDRQGNPIHRITRADLYRFTEVPDAVRDDLLFGLLVGDGSIELSPNTLADLKRIESDPLAGTDATGKRVVPADPDVELEPERRLEEQLAKSAKAPKTRTEPKPETK